MPARRRRSQEQEYVVHVYAAIVGAQHPERRRGILPVSQVHPLARIYRHGVEVLRIDLYGESDRRVFHQGFVL